MPYSTACNTPLSNFESGQNYKDVVDPAGMYNICASLCVHCLYLFQKKEREKAVVLYSNVYMMNILGVVVFVGHVKDSGQ